MKQKRLIMLTLLMSAMCLASYAQGEAPKQLKSSFGVKAGMNLSTISNGDASIHFSPAMKADFHMGLLANLHFGYRDEGAPVGTGWFGLQPELLYSRQGFAVDGEAIGFDYLTLPVMAKLYVTRNINIEAGPYLSYLLSTSPATTVIDDAEIPLSNLKSKTGIGVGIGAEYETRQGLTVGVRYNLGLSDMANNLQWKSNTLAVSVGWLFF
ncbi:MAG: PorT family protein [Tannerellaceae bacterium]|jgi:opacity protein-like surface antigen|nr:PorT family protein [Tannerellaceae bacterium]